MANSGNLPKHLEVAAQTAVIGAKAVDNLPYRLVAREIDLTKRTTNLVDLGGMPRPSRNAKIVDDMIEKFLTVEPLDFYLTLHLSQNAIDDDQTGELKAKFQDVLPAFQRDINSQVFTYLNAGDGTTLGTAIDGLSLFNDSHIYAGAKNQTAQDNKYAVALSNANFNTVWAAARQFKDDQENFYNYNYNLLVVNPTNHDAAVQITGNAQKAGTTNREVNPFNGQVSHIEVPEFDTNAWVVVADAPEKPIVFAIRKRPALLNMWFDSQAGDGGVHYFQYHGRYVVKYGDPLLAIMGQT